MKYCEPCGSRNRIAHRKIRAAGWRLVHEKLLLYGITPAEAAPAAHAFAEPEARCLICGVPNWFIRRLRAEGRLLPGAPTAWFRLHIDHIHTTRDRDKLWNLRLLCAQCNSTRRDGVLTDEQVLEQSWYFWTSRFPDRWLTWLHAPMSRQLERLSNG